MQSPVNIRFALLFFMAAMTTVFSTNKAPSNDYDKTIKSLETTLAKKLDRIIAVMNASSHRNPNVEPGIFGQCDYSVSVIVYGFLREIYSVFTHISSLFLSNGTVSLISP